MSDLLSFFRQRALEKSVGIHKEQFILSSLMKIHAQFKPQDCDLPYSDVIVVAQTTGVGSCYCYCDDPVLPTDILGKDARQVQTGNQCIDIAVLDAVYSSLLPTPDIYCRLEGSASHKAKIRSTFVFSEIQRLVQEINCDFPVVTMVGAVGNILSGLSCLGWQVYATDFDQTLVGKKLGGTLVEDGQFTLERIRQSNIALVTGMTLSTNTFEDIMTTAKACGTRIVMFAQTAGNFANEFLGMGVDCVVSEEYPFYMFPGITTLRIFRANHDVIGLHDH